MSRAMPTERILRSSAVRASGVEIVRAVSRGRPASMRACTVAFEEYASITFPTPVAWAGSRPPTREARPRPLPPRILT
jgi:hypothetical protein